MQNSDQESQTKVIAEIGCNHMGDFKTALEMVSVAAKVCKVDVVKFQKRHPRELLTPEQFDKPHPTPHHAFAASYGMHREALEFTAAQHKELKDYCHSEGVTYATSVWDLTSAREIAALVPDFIKIPSAANLNFELLAWLCRNYPGEIHLSAGMTTPKELETIVRFFEEQSRARDLVLYACTSGYPVRFEDICLLEISRLTELYKGRVKSIGFSGHHLGIAADVAAMALGAEWIERHFTLDRTWKGTDHAASLEPEGMRRLCRDIRNVRLALAYKSEPLLAVEVVQREKLKQAEKQS